MIEFELDGHDYIELHSLLKVTGLCESGGVAKLLVADGLVKVNGEVELRKRCKIRTGQTVELHNQQIIIH
ncbi:MAG: RNA-binding S4 domain-containing protein [Desulfuromonadales bacterium]|nr:RNA-binding S4 domain-containing protein [Desulfuromonadales bacterium]